MSEKKEFEQALQKKIAQQKGLTDVLGLANALIQIGDVLKAESGPYEKVIKTMPITKVEVDDSIDKMIMEVTKRILKERCSSKEEAEFILSFMMRMIYELEDAIKTAPIYKMLKE